VRLLHQRQLLWILLAILPVVLVVGLASGAVFVPPRALLGHFAEWLGGGQSRDGLILFSIRLPRLILAALLGLVLAGAGAAMQGLFRNPLADPSLIGVASGASAGAGFVVVFGGAFLSAGWLGMSLVAAGAFAGGFVAVLLVYRLATTAAGTSVSTMLLAGIAISAMAGALNSLFSFFADNDMLRRISLWQMGSLEGASWERVAIVAVAAVLMVAVLPRQSQALNALLLGESEARHLGVAVEALKRRIILITAFGVGIAVASSGIVAFVGLMVPHWVRLLIGPDHRFLIPNSLLLGAVFMVVADTLARVLILPAELPTGVITAMLGAPFFVSLLIQQRRRSYSGVLP
jgi:iron complex transport system permease protein